MLANFFFILAMIFLIIGAVGINRMPNIISKLLTSSIIDTMALILLFFGLILKSGFNSLSVRLLLVLLFLLLTNPIINHMITAAAYRDIHKGRK